MQTSIGSIVRVKGRIGWCVVHDIDYHNFYRSNRELARDVMFHLFNEKGERVKHKKEKLKPVPLSEIRQAKLSGLLQQYMEFWEENKIKINEIDGLHEVGDIVSFTQMNRWGRNNTESVPSVGVITKIRNKDKKNSNVISYFVDVYFIGGKSVREMKLSGHNESFNRKFRSTEYAITPASPVHIAKIRKAAGK